MREFMTRVSDYFHEWREDPERKENRFSTAVIVAVAMVIIVLLLLLLWWGHQVQERKSEETAQRAAKQQEAQSGQDIDETASAQGLVMTTYEEKMKEYMSKDSGEELRQEYLTNANALTAQVKELQKIMEKAQKDITAVVKGYQGGDAKLTEKLTTLEKESKTTVETIRDLETKLKELAETLRVADEKKIPAIQEQLNTIRTQIEQARADMAGVQEKIRALEQEDKKLWEKLSDVEKSLETALGESVKEFQSALEKMSEKMSIMSSEALAYRYEQETNTLYLMPNQEKK